MTCEDNGSRLTWEIQLYESVSHVWICRTYGRATTSAAPADIARAALAGYMAADPPRYGETLRAVARPDGGQPVTVRADELADDAWTADPAALQALPAYLRDALPSSG